MSAILDEIPEGDRRGVRVSARRVADPDVAVQKPPEHRASARDRLVIGGDPGWAWQKLRVTWRRLFPALIESELTGLTLVMGLESPNSRIAYPSIFLVVYSSYCIAITLIKRGYFMHDPGLYGKLAKFVKPGPYDPELDQFAAFVDRGAIISEVRSYYVQAEDRVSEMRFKPEGGLAEEHYRRLGTGPLERVQLARAVIENLLKRRGHGLLAIDEAFREVDDETLPDLVEEYSFETMTDALESTIGKPVPHLPNASSPASRRSSDWDARKAGEQIGERFEPAIGALADRIDSLKLDERLSSIQDDLARLVRGREPENPGYLTVEGVASWTSLSDSHIRRAIRGGDLPASNQGSDSHPTWRIALEDVKDWMLRKQGGDRKVVPPKSQLDDLIRRHLPGL